jgi:hypothetical protein
MSDNPYATPRSALEADQQDNPTFYVVSVTKLVVMSVMTAGLYQVYWHYRNWKLYKRSTGISVWPIARGVFNIFFEYVLFQRIDQCIKRSGGEFIWSPKTRAIALIGLAVIGLVLSFFMGFWLSLLWVVFSLGINIYLWIGAQRAINYFESDPLGKGNARFTLLNFVWMLVGLHTWYSMLNAFIFMEMLHGGVV